MTAIPDQALFMPGYALSRREVLISEAIIKQQTESSCRNRQGVLQNTVQEFILGYLHGQILGRRRSHLRRRGKYVPVDSE